MKITSTPKWILLIPCFALLFSCDNQASKQKPSVSEEPKHITEYKIEPFISGLEVPWDMVFTSENRMLITERPGRLRVWENGMLKAEPIHIFSDVSSRAEEGLMSLALDPEYEENQWIYLSWAYAGENGMTLKLARFKDLGNHLEDEKILMEGLPAAKYHAGSRVRFGPDGKLYITVGDALNKKNAQDLKSMAGKILRLNKDGSIPDDNPFPNSYVWSYGHRNSQGIAWHPETNEMYETEHGPSLFDGPRGGDEVNLIKKGGNYGWPVVSHDETQDGMIPPLITFTPAEPPGSLLIYSGKLLNQFKHDLFFGSLGGEGLIRLTLNKDQPEKISQWEKMEEINFGRIRNVIEGPDGSIYFSTSNRDGRGDVGEKDDQIFRITSK